MNPLSNFYQFFMESCFDFSWNPYLEKILFSIKNTKQEYHIVASSNAFSLTTVKLQALDQSTIQFWNFFAEGHTT